jgi:hypothetical protein
MNEKIELAQQGKKRCSKCKNIKETMCFTKQKQGFLGFKARCSECDKQYDKQFQIKTNYRANRDKTTKSILYRKNYIKNNIDWWRKYEREYRKCRRQEDMFFRIKGNLSARLADLINKKTYSTNTIELLGCNKDIFIKHIEQQFKEGMSWSNYGIKGWQIDHIKPLSSFDLTNEEELKNACHYTNLQPLWWSDNLKKGNKY